jgi:hypothetical protein
VLPLDLHAPLPAKDLSSLVATIIIHSQSQNEVQLRCGLGQIRVGTAQNEGEEEKAMVPLVYPPGLHGC